MSDDQNPQDEQENEQAPEISETEKIQAELEQMTQIAQRSAADFANYKRQMDEQRAELMAYANRQLLNAIFPAIDNLVRATENLPEDLADNEWIKGVLSTEKSLMDALASLGLAPIEATGVPMNPHQHEVLMEAAGPKGDVIQIFEKGYSFNGKTIRPAKVQVGNGDEA
ncbi:MAG: molecular chaperone GrpE [Oceanicoccus sp.]|jgi:molecular chaperone GrpE